MNIAICDDLKEDRAAIAKHLCDYFSNPKLTEFECGAELVRAHEQSRFDLILLDMLMPGLNGIQTAEKIRAFDEDTPIIFATTTEEFAAQSYRVLAFDYLLKPVMAETMSQCLSRFTKLVPDRRFISVDYMGVRTDILLENIVYLESELRKVIFHLAGGARVAVTAKLEEFLSLCDEPDFCRCHKSFLVNLGFVNAISGEDFCLCDDTRVRISRTFSGSAKKTYFDYVFGKTVDIVVKQ